MANYPIYDGQTTAYNDQGAVVPMSLPGSTKPVFIWFPDEGATEDITQRVTVNKFGGGYEQRIERGINTEDLSWTLTFTRPNQLIKPIREFLRARGAAQPFQWVNPFEELGLYVCRSIQTNKAQAGLASITVKFERVYEANV